MLPSALECMNFFQIYRLLTFDVFISVTSLLIKNENSLIRKKVIELIGEKIKSTQEFNHNEVCVIYALFK